MRSADVRPAERIMSAMSLSAEYRGTTWRPTTRGRALIWPRGEVQAWAGVVVPLALYAFTVVLLCWNIGGHPGFIYNWEQYTAKDLLVFQAAPSLEIFRPTDGLMTNSGTSPLIVLPIWLAFEFGNVGLTALRLPIALLAGLAVPLLWLLGRRLAGTGTATLAALLLALTPSFLLYARTATLVGLSVAPTLATALLLYRVLQRPQRWWALLGLQALLIVNTYAYAPIRILWPLSLALLGWELLWRRRERRWFLLALLLTAIALPTFIIAADQGQHKPAKALELYYHAGGEQVQNMSVRPDNFEPFLQTMPARGADGTYRASSADLARQLIAQNAADFANLLLDRETKSAIIEYWSPRGRLYTLLLVPFFFLGLGRVLWRAWRHLADRTLLALFLGFGVPILFTSRVHIGRLVFFLPFLLLVAASGFVLTVSWLNGGLDRLTDRLAGAGHDTSPYRRALLVALAAMLLFGVARSAWVDYRTLPNERPEARITALLAEAVPAAMARNGGVVLIVDDGAEREIEQLRVGEFQIALYTRYHFVDLAGGGSPLAVDAGRPALYYGNPLAQIEGLTTAPGGCANVYYLYPAFEAKFAAASAQHQAVCGQAPEYHLLPK